MSFDRRGVLKSLGMLGAGSLLQAAPASVQKLRFTKYEVMPTKVPMATRLREAWEESYRLQGRFQTHYDPIFVKLHTDEGITEVEKALMRPAQAEAILKRMMGRSPWEFLQDNNISGVLIAVYDVLGKTTEPRP